MALRISWRAFRSPFLHRSASATSRSYSTYNDSTYFSVETNVDAQDLPKVLATIKEQTKLTNSGTHNAAVLLATPQYVRLLENDAFMSDFVSLMSGSAASLDNFHVVSAVVDHIAPSVPRKRPVSGISVLRGRLDDLLPNLWQQEPPVAREDMDKVAALTFDLGSPRLTVPLANTTFQNHRTSTLFASSFELGQDGPRLRLRIEKQRQQVILPLRNRAQHPGLWAPLVPLTRPRIVTESFGNIVRRVNIDDDSVPASMELEPAVDELFKRKSNLAQMPMGIWAVITPPEFLPNGASSTDTVGPSPEAVLDEKLDIKALTASTSSHIQKLYGQGGRLYQILSGGGGWGAKKGLLSLDPQKTHFALSEEEEMQRFMQAMDGGNFVPVGSQIQFFTSPETSDDGSAIDEPVSGFVFGTSGKIKGSPQDSSQARILNNHFGALSNGGVFATSAEPGALETKPGFNNEWKLNVPHSRLFIK